MIIEKPVIVEKRVAVDKPVRVPSRPVIVAASPGKGLDTSKAHSAKRSEPKGGRRKRRARCA
jgi:hypothetical protein